MAFVSTALHNWMGCVASLFFASSTPDANGRRGDNDPLFTISPNAFSSQWAGEEAETNADAAISAPSSRSLVGGRHPMAAKVKITHHVLRVKPIAYRPAKLSVPGSLLHDP